MPSSDSALDSMMQESPSEHIRDIRLPSNIGNCLGPTLVGQGQVALVRCIRMATGTQHVMYVLKYIDKYEIAHTNTVTQLQSYPGYPMLGVGF